MASSHGNLLSIVVLVLCHRFAMHLDVVISHDILVPSQLFVCMMPFVIGYIYV